MAKRTEETLENLESLFAQHVAEFECLKYFIKDGYQNVRFTQDEFETHLYEIITIIKKIEQVQVSINRISQDPNHIDQCDAEILFIFDENLPVPDINSIQSELNIDMIVWSSLIENVQDALNRDDVIPGFDVGLSGEYEGSLLTVPEVW